MERGWVRTSELPFVPLECCTPIPAVTEPRKFCFWSRNHLGRTETPAQSLLSAKQHWQWSHLQLSENFLNVWLWVCHLICQTFQFSPVKCYHYNLNGLNNNTCVKCLENNRGNKLCTFTRVNNIFMMALLFHSSKVE